MKGHINEAFLSVSNVPGTVLITEKIKTKSPFLNNSVINQTRCEVL